MTKQSVSGTINAMMQYISTRGGSHPVSFSEAVLQGLAPDGGLFFPSHFPLLSEGKLSEWIHKPYAELAGEILSLFAPEIPREEIFRFCQVAYAPEEFAHPHIVPVTLLEKDTFLLELFHGPTGAFKDFALRLLPHLMAHAIRHGDGKHRAILVATSGDTGGAALSGFANVPNTSCIVFFPKDGVSALQEAQMRGARGNNVLSLGIEGNFDQAQSAVKEIFLDTTFRQELLSQDILLSSANSINIGRLIPQVVYGVFGYLQLVSSGTISLGEQVDITVPTGNFGDLFSAFLARKMGVPFGKLICANNENNSTAEFLKTGIFDISGKSTKKTLAPAMDILKASNIERLLFFLANQEPEPVRQWISERDSNGKFTLPTEVQERLASEEFASETISDQEILREIQKSTKEFQKTPDPHTATAIASARKHTSKHPMLIFSTAHWAKFGTTIWKALLSEQSPPKTEETILQHLSGIIAKPSLPDSLSHAFQQTPQHTTTIQGTTDDMKNALLHFFQRK